MELELDIVLDIVFYVLEVSCVLDSNMLACQPFQCCLDPWVGAANQFQEGDGDASVKS